VCDAADAKPVSATRVVMAQERGAGRGRFPGGSGMTGERSFRPGDHRISFGVCHGPGTGHKVVTRIDGYESGSTPVLVAETTVSGPWKEALNEGFRRLFSYISGNNEGAPRWR